MTKCPSCKNGRMLLTIHNGSKIEQIAIPCIDCAGAGEVTIERAKQITDMRRRISEIWCRCGNPSGHTTYHPDRGMSKHHWTCDDCGKVTQIG